MRNRLDQRLWRQHSRLCGVDEAGRGPLAGPVVAAAVILPQGSRLREVNDSKQLSARQRERLYDRIIAKAIAWSTGIVNHRGIDQMNIRNATFQAMRKAIAGLGVAPDLALVDGYPIPDLNLPQQGVIRGDTKSLSIAAASIIAKVTRDRIMARFHDCYPDYGFHQNKGYGTRQHIMALRRFGPCPIHRQSFQPVRTIFWGHNT